jgi:excisionase family DNA binding protein
LLPDFAHTAPGPASTVFSPPTARQNGPKRRGAQLNAVPDARPIVLSVSEVAAQLGVCRDTVYRLIQRGELPAARVGSLLRVRRPGLEAYLLRQRQGRQ